MDPLLVSVEEAARLLSIGRSSAYELIAAGRLPKVKVGRRTLVPVDAIRRWVEAVSATAMATETAPNPPKGAETGT